MHMEFKKVEEWLPDDIVTLQLRTYITSETSQKQNIYLKSRL